MNVANKNFFRNETGGVVHAETNVTPGSASVHSGSLPECDCRNGEQQGVKWLVEVHRSEPLRGKIERFTFYGDMPALFNYLEFKYDDFMNLKVIKI